MTNITDQQRREVAANLREYEPQDEAELAAVVVSILLARGMTVKNPAHTLADLIDRPTCQLPERWDAEGERYYATCTSCAFGDCTDSDSPESDDEMRMYRARQWWSVDLQDTARYCPNCGAEVVA